MNRSSQKLDTISTKVVHTGHSFGLNFESSSNIRNNLTVFLCVKLKSIMNTVCMCMYRLRRKVETFLKPSLLKNVCEVFDDIK